LRHALPICPDNHSKCASHGCIQSRKERSFAHINLTNYKASTTTIAATTNTTISSCNTAAKILTATTLAFDGSDVFAADASSGHPDEQRENHNKNPHILRRLGLNTTLSPSCCGSNTGGRRRECVNHCYWGITGESYNWCTLGGLWDARTQIGVYACADVYCCGLFAAALSPTKDI
jgi:hypothetical protein